MNLHTLFTTPGSTKKRKRVGNGEASGHGKTCCRGHKGQKARSGGAVRIGFEGGQMPLHRRLPKKGFSNARFQIVYTVINIEQLENLFSEGELITPESLINSNLVDNNKKLIKILGKGNLSKALSVKSHAFSSTAKQKIESAGGTVIFV